MKKYFFLILSIFLLFSCSDLFENKLPRHRFIDADNAYIPQKHKKINDILTYKSSDGKIIKIQNKEYFVEKQPGGGQGGFKFRFATYYYDFLNIKLQLLDVHNECTTADNIKITIAKTPSEVLHHNVYIPHSKIGCLYHQYYFDTPNDTSITLQEMMVNNVKYNKVLVLDCGPAFPYDLYDGGSLHKVYYDLGQGVIGFDDTENNIEFRITN